MAGAKSPAAWVQRPASEERGVTPGWVARVPANLLLVVQRQEPLWQLPPRLLWSDVNRGESVPSPGLGRTAISSRTRDQTASLAQGRRL